MPQFITHNANGISVWNTNGKTTQIVKIFDDQPNQENVFVSNDGNYLAILFRQSVKVYLTSNYDTVLFEFKINEPKLVSFSPKSTFIAIVGSASPGNDKNLKLYNLASGELVYESPDKKRESINWSSDESIAYRLVGSELLFFEKNDFSRCTKKLSQKVAAYSSAVNKQSKCNYVSIFVKGTKGAPSFVRVYTYPHFENPVASHSFFRADTVEMKWNNKGDALLVMANQDVDKTGKSYYGETYLHFMDLKGNACIVSGKNEGSVHSAEWLSKNDEFISVYGKMPAGVTLYNNKAEVVFQFTDSTVNNIHFNPFGNLVSFVGYGNLPGDTFIWNMKTRTMVSHFNASDTTHFSWLGDGLHFITSTHHARLKVGNGFKVWDYLGNLLHTEDCQNQNSVPLFKIVPVMSSEYSETDIGAAKGKLLCENPVEKYIPPFMRNLQQQKNNKSNNKGDQGFKNRSNQPASSASVLSVTEKKLKNLNKKLEQIEILKKSVGEGKQLEKNQLEKIEKEDEIIREINLLKLEA